MAEFNVKVNVNNDIDYEFIVDPLVDLDDVIQTRLEEDGLDDYNYEVTEITVDNIKTNLLENEEYDQVISTDLSAMDNFDKETDELLDELYNNSEDLFYTLEYGEMFNEFDDTEREVVYDYVNNYFGNYVDAIETVSRGTYTIFDDYEALGRYYHEEAIEDLDIPDYIKDVMTIDYEQLGKDEYNNLTDAFELNDGAIVVF